MVIDHRLLHQITKKCIFQSENGLNPLKNENEKFKNLQLDNEKNPISE